jgi:hypothetical protein
MRGVCMRGACMRGVCMRGACMREGVYGRSVGEECVRVYRATLTCTCTHRTTLPSPARVPTAPPYPHLHVYPPHYPTLTCTNDTSFSSASDVNADCELRFDSRSSAAVESLILESLILESSLEVFSSANFATAWIWFSEIAGTCKAMSVVGV